MFYTVRSLLENRGIPLKESAYASCSDEMLDFRIASGDFYDIPDPQNGILRFKNSVDVFGFEHLMQSLPPLRGLDYVHRSLFPYYGENLAAIRRGLENEPDLVCVEGGPCLFGEHEVTVIVTLSDGAEYAFDYSTGKEYADREEHYASDADAGEAKDLAGFLAARADRTASLRFVNRKTGLTGQEYLQEFFPFAVAAALDTALVMTLPDMSYRKYLVAAVAPLPQDIREKALRDFDAILYAISDMYLRLTEELKARFALKRFACVHGRDAELISRYMEARTPFIERNKILRHLTFNPAKLESIKDYISMPALPCYLYGSRYILEVNSMDETDSFRKCRTAHKGALELGCILFPELLSGDGEHTLYCAPIEFKDYGNYPDEMER